MEAGWDTDGETIRWRKDLAGLEDIEHRVSGAECSGDRGRSRRSRMRIAILTNEYPPHVYGGAGVHVEYLTRELASAERGRHDVSVICFGDQDIRDGNLTVRGINPAFELPCQDPGTRSSRRRCSGTWSW